MSSFFDILQEMQSILDTTGSSMQPSSIERLWELNSRLCASGNFRAMSHYLEIIYMKILQESYKKIHFSKDRLWDGLMEIYRLNIQQNIPQPQQIIQQNIWMPQQHIQQPQQYIWMPQQNIWMPQQNIQQAQGIIQHNQQLGQDSAPPGGNETPQQIQKRLRLCQWRWNKFQEGWMYSQQRGLGSQREQNRLLMIAQYRQLEDTQGQLGHRLQQLGQRLQQYRQQFEGGQRRGRKRRLESLENPYLPQGLHYQQGESQQHMEELLILACQVLMAHPEDDTLLGYLVDAIMYADMVGVPIKRAASYLSTDYLNHVRRYLEAETRQGNFSLAAETLQKLARERSLQDLSVVSILQSVKGDARRVWSLRELPEPPKELFHVPFQELHKEMKK